MPKMPEIRPKRLQLLHNFFERESSDKIQINIYLIIKIRKKSKVSRQEKGAAQSTDIGKK